MCLANFRGAARAASNRSWTVKKTLTFSLALAVCACGGSDSTKFNQNPNCQPGTGTTLNASCNPGFTQTAPNKPGTIYVTFSGEGLGVDGLPFPGNGVDPAFVDGWSVTFDELLIVVGNFRLAPGALQSADQSQVGSPVATKAGPYVLDMHKPSGFGVDKGGAGVQAGGIFKWDTDDSGRSFDTSIRYAFSYDVVKAAYPATQVNLTSAQFADYALMVQNGWSKLYRGTATFSGSANYPNAAVQAKFAALPSTVHFIMGWNDSGGHLNCINPDFGTGLANRGIQPSANGAVIAQVTQHVDHFFWDKLRDHNDIKLRFDPIAAWAPANTTALNPFDLRTLGSKPLAATFADGSPLPDRGPFQTTTYACGGTRPCAQVTLNLNGVTTVPGLANFIAFSSQSQMHMNADGLCYDVGQHSSDPFYAPGL
jgi:hypothetical protein